MPNRGITGESQVSDGQENANIQVRVREKQCEKIKVTLLGAECPWDRGWVLGTGGGAAGEREVRGTPRSATGCKRPS